MKLEEAEAALRFCEGKAVKFTKGIQSTIHIFVGFSIRRGSDVFRVKYHDGTYGDICVFDVDSVEKVERDVEQ
ncbi:hypothetical protein [Pseudomonas lactucae]|uniref:hypothetical protein n=1 Tax=Pseudomonas lactucae TaxID=2813360 RepID=UPI002FCD51DC